LCARCGGNLNLGECTCTESEIDPRWDGLEALLEEWNQHVSDQGPDDGSAHDPTRESRPKG
jgi:hypothetical protein